MDVVGNDFEPFSDSSVLSVMTLNLHLKDRNVIRLFYNNRDFAEVIVVLDQHASKRLI